MSVQLEGRDDDRQALSFDERHALETYRSLVTVATEGMKALQLVNGGAVVALLAYLGQAANRDQMGQVTGAIALFILGLVSATFAFFTTYLTQLTIYNAGMRGQAPRGTRHGPWWWATILAVLLSLVCFACGALTAVTALVGRAGP